MAQLPIFTWGHAILHVAILRLRSTSYHVFFTLQLITGNKLDISHLRTFHYVVYVTLREWKYDPTSFGNIWWPWYAIYNSILKSLMGDMFITRFTNCRFDEQVFSWLGTDETLITRNKELIWNDEKLYYLDSRTSQYENDI